MKPKLKARRMWANYYRDFISLHGSAHDALINRDSGARNSAVPVAVIPLYAGEGLIVTAAAAHYKAWSGIGKPTNGDCMRAALIAIGVLPPARAKKGRK